MNQAAKNLLKKLRIYYPLQGFYRHMILSYKKIKLRKQYAKFKGEGYNCNYCGSSYIKFAPWHPDKINKDAIEKNNVIAGYGENILCPYCLSRARERLLKAMTDAGIDIGKKKILHISPEKLFYHYIQQHASVTTVDYFPGFYKRVDPSIQFADATNLPFNDTSFDIVVANHIMEHIPNDLTAMKEIYRVLRPGGTAILQVPFSSSNPCTIEDRSIKDPARQSALFGQQDHVRIYALQDYLGRLRVAGFTVEYIPYESLQAFYQYAIQEGEGFISVKK